MAKFIKSEIIGEYLAVDQITYWHCQAENLGYYLKALVAGQSDEVEIYVGSYSSIEAAERAVLKAMEQMGTIGIIPYVEKDQ